MQKYFIVQIKIQCCYMTKLKFYFMRTHKLCEISSGKIKETWNIPSLPKPRRLVIVLIIKPFLQDNIAVDCSVLFSLQCVELNRAI